MNRLTLIPLTRPGVPRKVRAGTSALEALVAFTLLITTMSVATPLVVRHAHLLKSQRNCRLALDELANQMDRLTTLPADELPTALQALAPSTFLTERIPGVRLAGELQADEVGHRLVLKIWWNDAAGTRAPLLLAAWVIAPQQPVNEQAGGQP